ncbi:MAG: choice-of-anchor tandem repeat GloVer-containing protein [Limisphaerales bacterium]
MQKASRRLLQAITPIILGLGALLGVSKLDAQTLTVTTLHRFSGTDGSIPYYGLTQAGGGVMYGACYGVYGTTGGTVFKYQTNGTYTLLHTFNAPESGSAYNTGGANPLDGPIIATDGLLYGCTAEGGTGAYGVVYSMTTNGSNYSLLFQATATETGVEYQSAGIVQGSDGYLYGSGDSDGWVGRLGRNQ